MTILRKRYLVPPEFANENPEQTIRDALNELDKYLAMMNGRLERLLMSDLPDAVMADLITIYQAEREASQILHALNIFCQKPS